MKGDDKMKKNIKNKKVIKAVKLIGATVVSIGIGAIAVNVIKTTTPEDTRAIKRACINIGGFFVSGFAASAASDQFNTVIDRLIEQMEKVFDNLEKREKIKENET